PLGDLRAGAGKRQERHGDMRILDGQRERRAHLIAVERAVAGGAQPTGAVLRPILVGAQARVGAAGAIATVTGAARTVVIGAGRAGNAAEAEARVGERAVAIGIALAGGDGVTKAGDQQVARQDFGCEALDRAVGERNVRGADRRPAIADAQPRLLVAR